jgi:hypothetical protein
VATNLSRPGTQKALPVAEAKNRVLELIAEGLKLDEACAIVQRSVETYRDWMKKDPEFRASVQGIRTARQEVKNEGKANLPPFDVFCRDYLHQPLAIHQLRMWDVIEGRPPREMHPALRYDPAGVAEWEPRTPGDPAGRVIINIPPGFAKTTSISINYVTYLIHRNPNIKIVVVCKDQTLAKDILSAVKFRLTSAVYREMHTRFAPEGGWKDKDNSWASDRIRVQGKDDGEKDPTFQALGIGGRIYGARSDVIILDDSVTLANVREYTPQKKWLLQEVESRLDGGGLLALLGTRVAPTDLYSEMRETADWEDNKVFTYFSQPALLSEGDGGVATWESLWPERFPAKRLAAARRDEDSWAMVYQQQDVSADATFKSEAVEAAINRLRFPGILTQKGVGHREGGMDGLYVVGGLDPATVGSTAMIVAALDRETGKRYVLDGFNQANTSPKQMRDTVKHLTDTYAIREWVVEKNAFQKFLTQDPELNQFLQTRGCRLTEHYTTANKRDADWGIQTMSPLFNSCGRPQDGNAGGRWIRTPDTALIELPNPKQNPWASALINQLVIWQPEGMAQKAKTDLVMALWFTHIAFEKIMQRGRKKQTHLQSPFMSPGRQANQQVISLSALRREKQELLDQEGVG